MQVNEKASKYIFEANKSAKTSLRFEKTLKVGYRITFLEK